LVQEEDFWCRDLFVVQSRVTDEDLVRLRRSLAMAPSLPADAAERLLDEVARLRRARRDLAAELDELAGRIESLRQRYSDGP